MTEENGSNSPVLARAKFKFEGANNDELRFNKNDVVTITQQPEGGWWEGTVDGVTGWFPSAYVTLITEKDKLMRSRSVPNAAAKELIGIVKQPDYRAEVLEDFVKNETEYIEHLKITQAALLFPIKKAGFLAPTDYDILSGNFEEIYILQKSVLLAVETERKSELSKQRIGGIFMHNAGIEREALLKYAENHPKAVEVIKEKSKEIEKTLKEISKEKKELVSGLSEPLRHIEKYHTMLTELERIVPENHADRGDLQRSAAVFKETKELCETVRKQKETQMEFLYLSKVEKIVPFSERGMIIYVGVANVEFGDADPVDRFVALFTRYIMIFEITNDMSYKLEEKYQSTGFHVKKNSCNEIMLEKGKVSIKLTIAPAQGEFDRWFNAFSKIEGVNLSTVMPAVSRKSSRTANDIVDYALVSKPPPHPTPNTDTTQKQKNSKLFEESMNASGLQFDHELEMILPDGAPMLTSSRNSRSHDNHRFSRLMPCFLNGCRRNVLREDKGYRLRKDAARDEEEEFEVLRIIEGFCTDTASVADSQSESKAPQLIVAEDEKILVEERIGDEVIIQEKSIVDAVYSIKDQLSQLQSEFLKMTKIVEAEQKARRRLEHNLPKMSGIASPDGSISSRKAVNSTDS
ncbi:unnamed protein product [Caenorhabditis bovis]|uniref:Uncharacterized protein n=1 Tax=Caenorhabditis bovis TaxID=2654633 RepID=A0A8S1EJ89_9PELO|nr:unnamed protein product [Caenorhabditis bovis]